MNGNILIQVTNTTIQLLNTQTFELYFTYSPKKTIIIATGNLNQLVIGLTDGELLYFELNSNLKQLILKNQKIFENDIACLSLYIHSHDLTDETSNQMKIQTQNDSKTLLTVGLWTENNIRLYLLPEFIEIDIINLTNNDYQIRDILIATIGKLTYLLIGTGDGNLITYQMNINNNTIDYNNNNMDMDMDLQDNSNYNKKQSMILLPTRRKIAIGTRPLSFTSFINNSIFYVFIACDHSTVIYDGNDKLLFSTISYNNVNKMITFHCETFPESLCLTSNNGLLIGNINSIQKIQIQSYPVINGYPKRIIHIKTAINNNNLLIVGIEKMESNNNLNQLNTIVYEECRQYVVAYNDTTLEIITEYQMNVMEEILSLLTYTCHSNTNINANSSDETVTEYIIVGTAYKIIDEIEPTKGRILVLHYNQQTNSLDLVLECPTNAAVFSLAALRDKILAGVGNKVRSRQSFIYLFIFLIILFD